MIKSLFWHSSLVLAAAILLSPSPAKADFEISVNSGNLDAGGSLLLEIGIESDAAPENLSDFELILEITPISATGSSSLSFVDPQSEAFLEDTDYIFAASSESIADGLSTVTIDSATEITVIDVSSDDDGNFLNVPVTGPHLLASIDLQHNLNGTAPALTAGDQYEVRVGVLSGFFQADGEEIEFFSNSGTVTINAVAIPEPCFAAFLMVGCCGVAVKRRRRANKGSGVNRAEHPLGH